MKLTFALPLIASIGFVALAAKPSWATARELATVEAAADTLDEIAAIPLKGIPPALLQNAQGVAIIPNVIKAGLILGGRHGHGVVFLRDGCGMWGNPVFVTFSGGSIGWQIGVQSTDIILVFKTRQSVERILDGSGKVTLGVDVGVAAGPVGRQAEADTDGQLKAEIYSYSRSRGLFAGLSFEGGALCVSKEANAAFYQMPHVLPQNAAAMRAVQAQALDRVRGQLARMSGLTNPPAQPLIISPQPPIEQPRLLTPIPPPPPTPMDVLPPPRPVPSAPR